MNDLPPLPDPHWPKHYHGSVPSGGYTKDQMHEYARAALAMRGEQEPVASLMTHIQSGAQKVEWNDDGFDLALWHETPLYTAPPQRKPLTEAEIDAIPCTDGDGSDWEALVRFARAIEAAHGITADLEKLGGDAKTGEQE